MSHFPYIYGARSDRLTLEEIQMIAARLEIEYDGGSLQLDANNVNSGNLNDTSTKVNSGRVVGFHHNIVTPITSRENTTYINSPVRVGIAKNGKPVSNRVQAQIDKIYADMQFDTYMQRFEHMAALQGTVFAKPAFDEVNKVMRVTDLYPSDNTLKVKGAELFPGVPVELAYSFSSTDENGNEVEYRVKWTTTQLLVTKKTDKGHVILEPVEHKFGSLPWVRLRFQVSSTTIFNAPDIELDSFCTMRSRVLNNAVARLYLTDYEKLLITGMDRATALTHIRDRIIALPAQAVKDSDEVVTPTAQFISPDGADALNLLKAYGILWQQLQDTRGHVQKIFSRGADVPSAESIRLGSVELYNTQQRKRKFCEEFEQQYWELVKYYNNIYESVKIPDTTEMMLNFKPDPYSFNSAADEIAYFQAGIAADVETPITWIMHRNQEYDIDEATADFDAKKKFNAENISDTVENVPEPFVAQEDAPENEDTIEDEATT